MKETVRKLAFEKRRSLPEKEILRKSQEIMGRLQQEKEFEKADAVSVYVAIGTEVRTAALIAGLLGKGKKVLVPSIADKKKDLMEMLK